MDQPDRPPPRPALREDERCDLVIVGGGFTGLWAALEAKERDPDRDVVLLEATRIAQGASGRNGGFADPSLTHGLSNGLHHFPDEIDRLEAVGAENYAGFLDAIQRHGIDARVDSTGVLSVATAPYQVADMAEYAALLKRYEPDSLFLEANAARAELNSPTYHAAVWRRLGSNVDPARLAWGLGEVIARLGVRIYETTPMERLTNDAPGLQVGTEQARVRADKVILATNAFRSPIRRMRRATIPIWDYALMSEPLTVEQMDSIGWSNRQGVGDSGNQFHYYRLTVDNRILWGGFDAIYHYGNRIRPEYEQRGESFEGLSQRFFATLPQLAGLRFSHGWGGPIASTTRFCMDVGTAYGGRASWATGYTGLGVVASRFGGRTALDLLDNPEAPHLDLEIIRKRPFPWPPEPFRNLAVELTQRAMARADRNEGRRGPWLRLLDGLGLGFDS